VVRAISWHRRWLGLGLFDRLMCEVAMRRRRIAGRRATPTPGIIDTQTVKCIPVRGRRGYDAAKLTVGRKRVALVDVDGVCLAVNTVPASLQERDTLSALDVGSTHWGGLLRDRAGRLDVSAGRLAFAAILSGLQTVLNPQPIRAASL
jgi:hypothetical protein